MVATFTADPGEVAHRLPSSKLHPARWVTGQAVVMLLADDWAWTLGALPPVRRAEITVAAAVIYGR